MLPPFAMLATKKRVCCQALLVFALAVIISGCAPAGPRALTKGKKYFDRGDFAEAAAQFKIATTLLETNASAWNYYGVALQRTGQPAGAVEAYQRALTLNRDLMEVHYNLGCLWLEQDKPDAAKAEFTAYTLRRPNQLEGWLKLGSAQLRSGEILAAEKSFSTAYYLNTNNAEALNGLGLSRVQRGRPREASQFFAAAIQKQSDYSAAYLNLATVAKEYLHDNDLALRNYRAYLQLMPDAANAAEVRTLVAQLDQSAPPPVTTAPAVATPVATTQTSAPAVSHAAAETAEHLAGGARSQPAVKPSSASPPPAVSVPPSQVVNVPPAPLIVVNPAVSPANGNAAYPGTTVPAQADSETTSKTGLWQKVNPTHWFGGGPPKKKYEANGVTPLPADWVADGQGGTPPPVTKDESPAALGYNAMTATPSKPARAVQPVVPNFARYHYVSPAAPAPGNRTTAEGAFNKAKDFEGGNYWTEALEWYHQAILDDPSWFTAQYNTAIMAYRQKHYTLALTTFETALAIQSDSADARYGFAITLKSAGYPIDAVNELNKLVVAKADDARVHLALGNIYAQQLHDVANARTHYLKLLELDPNNPQASNINFWLAANPQ